MELIELAEARVMNPRFVLRDSKDTKVSDIYIKDDSFSIIDYAREPLLSLTEACEPLVPIINNISNYALMAIKNTPEKPAHGLTHDESASIRLYTMEWPDRCDSLYFILNSIFKNKNQESLQPWYRYLKLFLTALVKIPCEPVQTVWRGVKVDVSKEFLAGMDITWWSFSSCTKALSLLENDVYLGNIGSRTLFSIEIFNGRAIRAHSDFVQEEEILLLPGTHLEVLTHLPQESGLHIIHLKQKTPTTTLLEPPFRGIHIVKISYSLKKTYKSLIRCPSVSQTFRVSAMKSLSIHTVGIFLPIPHFRRRWYRQKRFCISISLLTALLVMGIVLGTVLGIRSQSTAARNITSMSLILFSI